MAHGDKIQVLATTFRIGRSTLYAIIPEVCQIIFEELHSVFLTLPEGDDWLHIAQEFQRMWQFPNMLGAIDTRQIVIKKPPNSGSFFWNYKQHFSMGLMAACDAHKRFLWANVGSYGKYYYQILVSKLITAKIVNSKKFITVTNCFIFSH